MAANRIELQLLQDEAARVLTTCTALDPEERARAIETSIREIVAETWFAALHSYEHDRAVEAEKLRPKFLDWHPGRHQDWKEHDGFRRHAHSQNGLLTIDPGDSQAHFSGGIPFDNPKR